MPHAEKQKHSITTTPETKKLYIQSLDNLNETEKNYVISSIKKQLQYHDKDITKDSSRIIKLLDINSDTVQPILDAVLPRNIPLQTFLHYVNVIKG